MYVTICVRRLYNAVLKMQYCSEYVTLARFVRVSVVDISINK